MAGGEDGGAESGKGQLTAPPDDVAGFLKRTTFQKAAIVKDDDRPLADQAFREIAILDSPTKIIEEYPTFFAWSAT